MTIPVKKTGKRGRKPSKIDTKAKLERSRQSARECRARKKLRYQYLEELVTSREKAIVSLRNELETYKKHCQDLDQGKCPKEIRELLQTRHKSNTNADGARASGSGGCPENGPEAT